MNPATHAACLSYVSKIRNQKKRHYAEAYLGWVKADKPVPEPDEKTYQIKYMTAQSVRLGIHKIIADMEN